MSEYCWRGTRYNHRTTILYCRQNFNMCKCVGVCVCDYVSMYMYMYMCIVINICDKIIIN